MNDLHLSTLRWGFERLRSIITRWGRNYQTVSEWGSPYISRTVRMVGDSIWFPSTPSQYPKDPPFESKRSTYSYWIIKSHVPQSSVLTVLNLGSGGWIEETLSPRNWHFILSLSYKEFPNYFPNLTSLLCPFLVSCLEPGVTCESFTIDEDKILQQTRFSPSTIPTETSSLSYLLRSIRHSDLWFRFGFFDSIRQRLLTWRWTRDANRVKEE